MQSALIGGRWVSVSGGFDPEELGTCYLGAVAVPANLTPQYLKAEEEYRKAQSPAERIVCLENMIRLIPKHKGTDHLQGELRRRLAEAREEQESERKAPKKGAKSYRFPRQGAGQIVLLGAPNSGKSKVVRSLTNATPEVADYPYTTREPAPAMMSWEDVFVQLVDTPPISEHQFEPYHVNLARTADAVALCFNGASDDAPEETERVLKQLAERKTLLAQDSGFVEEDYSLVRVKTLLLVTQGSDPQVQERLDFFRELVPTPFESVLVDLEAETAAESLRTTLFRFLNVIRVYTKAPGKPADYKAPFTLPAGGTVEDLALRVHKELAEKLKFAKVWGTSAHDGQSVGPDHVLHERDLVELHT